MKKISLMRWALILITSIELTLSAVMGTVASSELKNEDVSYFEAFLLVISFIAIHGLFIAALVRLYHALGYFKEYGYFNIKSSNGFKTSGMLILLSALSRVILALIGGFPEGLGSDEFLTFSFHHAPTLLIGFGLLIIADFIKEGVAIEQENQLTI